MKSIENNIVNNSVNDKKIVIPKNINNNSIIKTSTLVISINDFHASQPGQLNIKKNEYLIVTDWNCEDVGYTVIERIMKQKWDYSQKYLLKYIMKMKN